MLTLMEYLDKKSLKTLIERAHALHDRLSDEIKSSISFCRFCSERGRYCESAEASFEERERLIAIRDSLKEVEDMLIFLQMEITFKMQKFATSQSLQAWQLIDRDVALTRFENSRLCLMELVTGYQGRDNDVVKELNACFGNKRITFICNGKESKEAEGGLHKVKRRIPSFLICFNPWRWQQAVGNAVKFIAISASISYTIHLYHSRRKYRISQRKILSFVDSANAGIKNTPLTSSTSQLDVFYGRG